MRGRVLIVDDDVDMCELLAAGLKARDFEATYATSADEGLGHLQCQEYAAVITDVCMRGISGLDFCSRITTNYPQIPVIVITAFGSLETAVAAIRAGAYDFITKPLNTEELAMTLERAAQLRGLRDEVKRLRCTLDRAGEFSTVLGESPQMQKVCALMARIGDSDASVLITGETGTGKKVVARALHDASPRGAGPFITVNCTAAPEPMLESELFGGPEGSHPEARGAREGLFHRAGRGTLFFDEIGGMPLALQLKLLRVLQDRPLRPAGTDTEAGFDVRIVAATNRDLESAVAEGQFLDDLYFRINVIHIELPPLRARGNDVLLLGQHFIRELAARTKKEVVGLSTHAAQKLLAYPWPGNVRELQNCMERAVALATCDHVMVDDLPEKVAGYQPSHVLIAGENPSELVTMEEVEKRYIRRVLDTVGGNKTLAARVLGFDRKTLYRKLESYAILERLTTNRSD